MLLCERREGGGGVGMEQSIVPSHWRSAGASLWHILILGVLSTAHISVFWSSEQRKNFRHEDGTLFTHIWFIFIMFVFIHWNVMKY